MIDLRQKHCAGLIRICNSLEHDLRMESIWPHQRSHAYFMNWKDEVARTYKAHKRYGQLKQFKKWWHTKLGHFDQNNKRVLTRELLAKAKRVTSNWSLHF